MINLGVNDPPILTTSTDENDNYLGHYESNANSIGGTSGSPAVTASDEDIGSTFTYAIAGFCVPHTNTTATLLSDCPIAIDLIVVFYQ